MLSVKMNFLEFPENLAENTACAACPPPGLGATTPSISTTRSPVSRIPAEVNDVFWATDAPGSFPTGVSGTA